MDRDTENSSVDSLLVHKATPEYLQDLLNDKKQLQHFPNIFLHVEIILEKEITRVRQKLFHLNESTKKQDDELPEPEGSITTLQEKVCVPINENPNYNFVGRLLGPRGLTAKQLEQDLECKIMVRGRGSLRDKKKEDMNRGKPNWEHLDEDLHVLVSVEDYENRAAVKLRRATGKIRGFLEQGVRTPENEDRLKQLQLMELAVLNDKDRQQANAQQLQHQHQQQQQQLVLQHQSFTLLNNQVAAAAAAAAAQMLQPSRASQQQQQQQLQASQLLVRLSSQSPLVTPSLYPFSPSAHALPCATAAGSGVPSLPSSAFGSNTSTLAGVSQSNNVTSGPTAYLRNTGLPSTALGQLATGSTLSTSTVNNGPLGLNFSTLSQLQSNTNPGFGLPGLGFSGLPLSLQNSISSNLISCSTGANADPLAAMAAALLNGAPGNVPVAAGQHLPQLTNGQMAVNKSVPSIYPMTSITSPMLDAVNIFEYGNVSTDQATVGGDSLKMRTVSNARMHPYFR